VAFNGLFAFEHRPGKTYIKQKLKSKKQSWQSRKKNITLKQN